MILKSIINFIFGVYLSILGIPTTQLSKNRIIFQISFDRLIKAFFIFVAGRAALAGSFLEPDWFLSRWDAVEVALHDIAAENALAAPIILRL